MFSYNEKNPDHCYRKNQDRPCWDQRLGMELEDLLDYESSRMKAFKIISECYILPDSHLSDKLEELVFCMKNISGPAVAFIKKMLKEFNLSQNLEPLKVDYSKLFIGPYNVLASPYGSVYLDSGRQIMGESTIEVKKRYRESGLDISKAFKGPPDHISTELEYMYFLVFKEIESFSGSDTDTAIGIVKRQKSFLEHHLLTWVPQFSSRIIEHAETMFYSNLAIATETFLNKNCQIVGSILDSLHNQRVYSEN